MQYRRGWVALFLFTLTLINYVDRVTLSFAADPISREFGLSPVTLGYLFSSFLWTYTLFLLPMRLFVDRFGAKRVAGWGIGLWSIATAAEFSSRMDRYIAKLKSVPLAQGFDEIVYPGEIEARNDLRNRAQGLLLPDDRLGDLRKLTQEGGLTARLPF